MINRRVTNLGRWTAIVAGLTLALTMSGCVSSASRKAGISQQQTFGQTNPITSVTADFAPGVKKDVAFDTERFEKAIKIELENRDLYSENVSGSQLSIDITKLRVRSSISAMVFGAAAGSDSIHGDVIIRGLDGSIQDTLEVKASYALGGLGGSANEVRMDWLYEAFAKKIGELLTEGS